MTRLRIIVPAALLSLIATGAGAQTQSISVSTGVTNYSGSFDKRTETTLESNIHLGNTAFVIGAAPATHGTHFAEHDHSPRTLRYGIVRL